MEAVAEVEVAEPPEVPQMQSDDDDGPVRALLGASWPVVGALLALCFVIGLMIG